VLPQRLVLSRVHDATLVRLVAKRHFGFHHLRAEEEAAIAADLARAGESRVGASTVRMVECVRDCLRQECVTAFLPLLREASRALTTKP
jgi:hypothetical protein